MKLYYTPGACSQAVHIALVETGLPFTLERVDLANKQTASGTDFRTINPLGYVPVLELDDGRRLTEAQAILQYIADEAGAGKFGAKSGGLEHYELIALLAFISSELHKGLGALFAPNLPEPVRQAMIERVGTRFDHIEARLGGKLYLLGSEYTIADMYLFVITGWLAHFNIDIARWPKITAWRGSVGARPAVQAVLAAEFGAKS